MAQRLGAFLLDRTGRRWIISVSRETGDATYAEQNAAAEQRLRLEAEADPLVKAALALFPGARIDIVARAGQAASESLLSVAVAGKAGDYNAADHEIEAPPPGSDEDPGPFAGITMIDPDEEDGEER
jgi:hypothetical protein